MAGRPTDYREEYNEQAEKQCRIYGAVDKKIAEFFEVSEVTLNAWKKEYPEFLKSLKNGKDYFDTNKVEKSLLKRALGYKTKEIHKEKCTEDGCLGTKIKTVTKQIISDTAILFWLKNRNPERWRDIKAVVVTGPNDGPIKTQNVPVDLSNFTDEELEIAERIARKCQKQQ